MEKNWNDDDKLDLFSGAIGEPIPLTMPSGSKSVKKFGINSNTEFQSPSNTASVALGFPGRKLSQGRGTSNARGGAESWNGMVASDNSNSKPTKIVAGASLSTNKPPVKSDPPLLHIDTFGRAQQMNIRVGGPGELSVASKSSTNYSKFQQNTHSNNVSPNALPLSKTLQSLQPANTTNHKQASRSTDFAYIGHSDPSRTANPSATTSRAPSRNSAQTKGNERATTKSYEAKQGEIELRPHSYQNNHQYPASSSLPTRAPFNTPYNKNTKNTNSNNASSTTNANNNINSRNTRNSARKSPNNEVIDLLDSDVEEVEPLQLAQQKLDNDIFKLYGSLPGFSDNQKRNAFSKTSERLKVDHIYLGIYRFDSSSNSTSSARELYIRVDGGNNQCILLGLNTDSNNNTRDPDGTISTAPIEIEEIPFDKIKKIM